MADTQAPPPLPKSHPSFGKRHRTIIKLLGVGALVLLLLIPLAMISGAYLLLLSVSEFIGFSWAYLIAAVASTC